MSLIPKAKQMYVKTKYKIFDYLAPRINESVFEAYARFKSRNLDDTIEELDEEDLERGRQPMPSQKQMVINNYMAERKRRLAYLENAKAYKKGLVDDPNTISVKTPEEGRKLFNDPVTYYKELELKAKVATAAVVATQSPTAKESYNDSSPSSFKTKKNVYDSIPSTKSSGVMTRASNPETFKNGVVNMARTMDASANQISKLLKMDAKLLEELYYDKPFLFDLYFEYSLYEDFGASHEDSGINKLIESYEYKYGVTL